MTDHHTEGRGHTVDRLTAAAFMLFVLGPLAVQPFSRPSGGEMENRAPAPRPPAPSSVQDYLAYPRAFENYLNDNFGLRAPLLRGFSFLLSTIGVSSSDLVMMGRDGWLFLGGESVENLCGRLPLAPEDARRLRQKMQRRARYLAQRNIRFLVVVAPDKQTIYPEFMPYYIRPSLRPDATQLTTLAREMAACDDVAFLDLRPALRAARQGDRLVYHRTDTHWNPLGAYHACRAIVDRLATPDMPLFLPPLSEYHLSVACKPGMGNSLRLGLASWIKEKEAVQLSLHGHSSVTNTVYLDDRRPVRARVAYTGHAAAPRILVFGDSFMNNLFPFLAESARATAIADIRQTGFDTRLIDRINPDIVIYEFVARNIRMHARYIAAINDGRAGPAPVALD